MPHTPSQFFWKYPPGFLIEFRTQKAGHCSRCSLRRPWKLGLRIVAWLKQRMFWEESLWKIKFRAFWKHVGPWILLLESVDILWNKWTLLSGRKKMTILISKIVMVGCCKLSLYANESCDEHAIYFWRLKWRAM